MRHTVITQGVFSLCLKKSHLTHQKELLATQSQPGIARDLGRRHRTYLHFPNTPLFPRGNLCIHHAGAKLQHWPCLRKVRVNCFPCHAPFTAKSPPHAKLALLSPHQFTHVCNKGTSCFSATLTSLPKGRAHCL